jgi:hypothetical protein
MGVNTGFFEAFDAAGMPLMAMSDAVTVLAIVHLDSTGYGEGFTLDPAFFNAIDTARRMLGLADGGAPLPEVAEVFLRSRLFREAAQKPDTPPAYVAECAKHRPYIAHWWTDYCRRQKLQAKH